MGEDEAGSSGTGAEPRRKKCWLFCIGEGQQSGKLVHKQDAVVLDGSYSLGNLWNSRLEVSSKFQGILGNGSSLLLVLSCSC